MNDDATLVELAKSGDQAAFAQLYERYFDRVYDFVARTVRDPSEAADLTQDAFLKAMNSLAGLEKGASFKSWLFTIARNTALNRIERASRTQPLEGTNDEGEEQRYDVIDTDRFGNPEEAAEAADLAAIVWEAAEALEPKYRSVLLLNLREGLDSAEIADVMGVTKNHAYVLVNRMKAALESAVGAVALFRNGRRHCKELDAAITRLQIAGLTPEGRRVIERHAGSCETCSDQRRKLSSPFAIIAGIGLVSPAPGVRESIFSSLQQALVTQAEAAVGGAGASNGSNAAAGLGDGGQSGVDGGTGYTGQASPSDTTWRSNAEARTPTAAPAQGGGLGGKRRRAVLGVVAAILLLVGVPIVAFSSMSGGDSPAQPLMVVENETTQALAPGETPSATATRTPTAIPSPEHTATPSAPATIAAAAPSATSLAPGLIPPSVTPDVRQGSPANGGGVSQPPPVTNTPAEPSVTPAISPTVEPSVTPTPPCVATLQASPRALTFAAGTSTQTVRLTGNGCGDSLPYTATSGSPRTIVVQPASGKVSEGLSSTLTVVVPIDGRVAGSGRIVIESQAGAIEISVTIEAATPVPGGPNLRDPSEPCGVNCRVSPTPTARLGFTN